jgi:hypothetical protein
MDGDTYGGSAWMAQFFQLLNAAAAQNINLADLLGYYTEGAEPATPDPTENDALDAIWANRPDLKEFYDNAWGEGQYDPREAVRNWLAMTDEIQDPAPGDQMGLGPEQGRHFDPNDPMGGDPFELGGPAVTTNPRDPLAYALAQGYVQPGSEGSEGEQVPTLEREIAEANQQYQNAMLELQQGAQDLQRELNLSNQEFQLALQEADHLFELQLHGETLAFEQEKFAFQQKYQMDQLDWQKFVDTKTLELQARQLEQSGKLDDAQIQYWHDQIELERYATDLDAELRREEMDIDKVWKEGQLAQGERELDIKEQLGQGQLGLGYLELLGSMRGPDNWMQYWNVQRNAQNTQLPAWASALLGNVQQTPAFQGAGTGVPEGMSGIQGAPDAMMQQGGIQLQPTGDAAQQTFAAMSKPFVQGHQVTPAQWASLNPSEQAGLGSVIEYQGGYMPDWMQSMMKAAPKVGQGAGGSYFQGW